MSAVTIGIINQNRGITSKGPKKLWLIADGTESPPQNCIEIAEGANISFYGNDKKPVFYYMPSNGTPVAITQDIAPAEYELLVKARKKQQYKQEKLDLNQPREYLEGVTKAEAAPYRLSKSLSKRLKTIAAAIHAVASLEISSDTTTQPALIALSLQESDDRKLFEMTVEKALKAKHSSYQLVIRKTQDVHTKASLETSATSLAIFAKDPWNIRIKQTKIVACAENPNKGGAIVNIKYQVDAHSLSLGFCTLHLDSESPVRRHETFAKILGQFFPSKIVRFEQIAALSVPTFIGDFNERDQLQVDTDFDISTVVSAHGQNAILKTPLAVHACTAEYAEQNTYNSTKHKNKKTDTKRFTATGGELDLAGTLQTVQQVTYSKKYVAKSEAEPDTDYVCFGSDHALFTQRLEIKKQDKPIDHAIDVLKGLLVAASLCKTQKGNIEQRISSIKSNNNTEQQTFLVIQYYNMLMSLVRFNQQIAIQKAHAEQYRLKLIKARFKDTLTSAKRGKLEQKKLAHETLADRIQKLAISCAALIINPRELQITAIKNNLKTIKGLSVSIHLEQILQNVVGTFIEAIKLVFRATIGTILLLAPITWSSPRLQSYTLLHYRNLLTKTRVRESFTNLGIQGNTSRKEATNFCRLAKKLTPAGS